MGGKNVVNGSQNMIYGENNIITGDYNWIFISDYVGKIKGNIVVGRWKLELDKIDQIILDPRNAISLISFEEMQTLLRLYNEQK